MPAKKPDELTEAPAPREVRECPSCHTTIFVGPISRGEIVADVLEARDVLYECVKCGALRPLAQLPVRVSLAAIL